MNRCYLSSLPVFPKEWCANSSPYFGPSTGGITFRRPGKLLGSVGYQSPQNRQCIFGENASPDRSFLFHIAPSITTTLNLAVSLTKAKDSINMSSTDPSNSPPYLRQPSSCPSPSLVQCCSKASSISTGNPSRKPDLARP